MHTVHERCHKNDSLTRDLSNSSTKSTTADAKRRKLSHSDSMQLKETVSNPYAEAAVTMLTFRDYGNKSTEATIVDAEKCCKVIIHVLRGICMSKMWLRMAHSMCVAKDNMYNMCNGHKLKEPQLQTMCMMCANSWEPTKISHLETEILREETGHQQLKEIMAPKQKSTAIGDAVQARRATDNTYNACTWLSPLLSLSHR